MDVTRDIRLASPLTLGGGPYALGVETGIAESAKLEGTGNQSFSLNILE